METVAKAAKPESSAKAVDSVSTAQLMQWMHALQFGDSTLPTGAFTFSHGLESAIERGLVTDAASLHSYVKTAVEQASVGDGVGLLNAYRSAKVGDIEGLLKADRAIYNRKLNEETRTMTVRTGRKLIELADKVIGASRSAPVLSQWREKVTAGETPGCYPVCQALIFAELDIPEDACFMVHQYGVAMAILSAALRMVRVDHVDTQTILFKLNQTIAEDYAMAATRKLEDMANFAPVVDLLAAIHVKAHVRLFMN